jgi:hypothetical protein
MSEYNMPPIDLFGKRCRIKHVSDLERGFVYRIVNSGVRSNCWKELPLGRYGNEPIQHDTMEDVVFVVCDTLIDEMSKIERVALKDIEIMQGETIPLDKVKQARAEISDWDVNEVMDGCSEPFRLGVARGLDIASEILDKLLESEEKE